MEPQSQHSQPHHTFDSIFDHIWNSFSDIHQEYNLDYSEQSKLNIKNLFNQSQFNYALGAMYGAFIGDALGSFLEFNHYISTILIDQAMSMPGGGRAFPFLKPGQFTDDSQMASHMLTALTTYDPSTPLYKQEKPLMINIAEQYLQWYRSGPFDVGITTRVALNQLDVLFEKNTLNKASSESVDKFHSELRTTFKKIVAKNLKSQSNGSLMRITPMAFFISTLIKYSQKANQKSFAFYEDFVQDEINMTHGNQAIFQSSKTWVDLLTQLILREGKSVNQVYNKFEEKYKENGERNYQHVQEWIRDSKKEAMDAVNSMGWAKIAYTHGLRQLRDVVEKEKNQQEFMNASTFKEIMRKVLTLEGDTDTNGAIVGGLIGAVVGFKNLPYDYLEKQFSLKLQFDQEISGSRGSEQEPRRQLLKAISLIQKIEMAKA